MTENEPKCPQCGEPLPPRKPGTRGGYPSKFCSTKCRKKALRLGWKAAGLCSTCGSRPHVEGRPICQTCIDSKRRSEDKIAKSKQTKCPQCGTGVPQPEGRGRKGIYCSDRCRSQASRLSRKARGAIRPRRKSAAEPRPCVICSIEFTPWRNGQKTCGSQECQKAHHRNRQSELRQIDRVLLDPRPCVECGAEFKPKQSTHYTCGPVCGKALAARKSSEKWHAEHTDLERKCDVCGTAFTARNPNKRYCGQACYEAARRERVRAKSVLVAKSCVECGQEFHPRSNAQILCSDPCREEHKRRSDADRYERKGPYRPEWMQEMDEAIVKGTRFTEREQKAVEHLGHYLILHADWHRTHTHTLATIQAAEEEDRPQRTPRSLHGQGVHLHQQIRQLLGIRKGGEDDPFRNIGLGAMM